MFTAMQFLFSGVVHGLLSWAYWFLYGAWLSLYCQIGKQRFSLDYLRNQNKRRAAHASVMCQGTVPCINPLLLYGQLKDDLVLFSQQMQNFIDSISDSPFDEEPSPGYYDHMYTQFMLIIMHPEVKEWHEAGTEGVLLVNLLQRYFQHFPHYSTYALALDKAVTDIVVSLDSPNPMLHFADCLMPFALLGVVSDYSDVRYFLPSRCQKAFNNSYKELLFNTDSRWTYFYTRATKLLYSWSFLMTCWHAFVCFCCFVSAFRPPPPKKDDDEIVTESLPFFKKETLYDKCSKHLSSILAVIFGCCAVRNEIFYFMSFAYDVRTVYFLLTVLLSIALFCCCFYRSQIVDFVKTLRTTTKVAKAMHGDLKIWASVLEDPTSLFNYTGFQPIILEAKSILHACYHFHCGDTKEAFSWLTNLMFTRPQMVLTIMGLAQANTKLTVAKDNKVVHDGQSYSLTSNQKRTYDMLITREVDPKTFLDSIITVESLDLPSLIPTLYTAFQQSGLSYISKTDLAEANSHYTYLNNVRRDASYKVDAITKLISLCGRFFFGCDPFDPEYQSFTQEILEVFTFCEELNLKTDFGADKLLLNRTIAKYKQACSLLVAERFEKHPTFIQAALRQAISKLEAKARDAAYLLGGTQNRVEPLCMLFTGPPGVGKSGCIKFLCHTIPYVNGELFSPENVYNYNPNSDFWEGYLNQDHVVIDDLFKEGDKAVRMKQACDIISMVNINPHPLSMAFENKGKVFFNSKYLYLTTNVANNGLDEESSKSLPLGLTDNNALFRRFHVIFHKVTPMEGEIETKEFLVTKCKMIPTYVGKVLTPVQMVELVNECRAVQMKQHAEYELTPDKLARLFPKSSVVTESLPLKVLDPVEFFKFVATTLKESPVFKDPKTYGVMMCLFFVLFLIARSSWIYNLFWGEEIKSDSAETGNKMGRRQIRTIRSAERSANMRKYHVSSQSNSDTLDMAANGQMANAVLHMWAKGTILGKEICESCVGFHIRDGFVCVPAHFFLVFEEANHCEMVVSWRGFEQRIAFPSEAMHVDGEDIVIFKLPKMSSTPSSLYAKFPKACDMYDYPSGHEMRMMSYKGDENFTVTKIVRSQYSDIDSYAKDDMTFTVNMPITYVAQTARGDSGSVILVGGPGGSPIAIGMHVASTKRNAVKIGIAVSLWRELFDSVIGALSPVHAVPFPMEVLSTVTESLAHYPPSKSRITRSALHGCFGDPITMPAYLHVFVDDNGDTINPLMKAVAKMHQTETVVEEYDETPVIEALLKHYPPCRAKVLSLDDALTGNLYCDTTNSINMTTSPGYPFSLKKLKGKSPYLVRNPDDSLSYEPTFRKHMEGLVADLELGKQISVIFADILKDETRPIAKAKAGKTRLFSTGPLDYLILVRMYFLEYFEYVQKRCVEGPISIGIDAGSYQWFLLFKRLMSKAKSIVAGDFSNFDGKLPRRVGRTWLRFVNAWYNDGPVNARVRELLFEHMSSAMHILFQYIYQVLDGNPSGQGGTSHYNSACQFIMLFIVLTLDFGLTPEEFELALYGDDNVISCILIGLRVSHLAPHLKRRFDMDYTHFSKEVVDRDDTLFTIRYLGRAFVWEGSYLRAPLELDTVKEIPYWVHGDVDRSLVAISCASSFYRELSHHPKPVFEELSLIYEAACRDRCPLLCELLLAEKRTYSTYICEMYVDDKDKSWSQEGLKKFRSDLKFGAGIKGKAIKSLKTKGNTTIREVSINHIGIETESSSLNPFVMAARRQFVFPTSVEVNPPLATFSGGVGKVCYDGNPSGKPKTTTRIVISDCVPRVVDPKIVTESKIGGQGTAGVPNEVQSTRNEQFSDRATNPLVDTQTHQLGSYQDASEVAASSISTSILQKVHASNNMEIFDMNRSLERSYIIDTPAWTTDQTAGTTLATYDFPAVLFDQDYISSKVSDFHNFRAGARVSVRIQSSKFLYGKLMLVYTPDSSLNGYYAEMNNIYMASGYPHLLISASASESAIMDIPFISPQRALSIPTLGGQEMGSFKLIILNPLTNINGDTDSCNIVVTAQFLDVECFLPTSAAPDFAKRMAKAKRTSAANNFIHTESKRESNIKSKLGIISSKLEVTTPEPGAIKVPKFIRPYVDMFKTVAENVVTGLAVGSMIGLNKPTTSEIPGRAQLHGCPNYSAGKGIDLANKFAMDPEAAISTEPIVAGIDYDEMDLAYVMGTPQMTSQFGLVAATPDTLVATTSPFALMSQYTYVDFVTRNFRFCSGSYKFKCYITASMMHSVRLVFYLSQAPTDFQDCYYKMVDVQGDTEVEFTVPHCTEQVVRDNTTETLYWNVYVKVLAFSSPVPEVSAPIYLNVYKAAASDFRVGCLQLNSFTPTDPAFIDRAITTESNPRQDFSKVFEPLHPSIVGYVPDKVVYPEEYTSVRDIVHRQAPYGTVATNVSINVYQFHTATNVTGKVFGKELWGLLYMYWRGSVRVQYMRKGTITNAITAHFADNTNIPGLDLSFTDKPIIEAEIPWYSQLLYEPTGVNLGNGRFTNLLSSSNSSYYSSAMGDDASFHFLKPIPLGMLAVPTSTTGYNGLATFFNQ